MSRFWREVTNHTHTWVCMRRTVRILQMVGSASPQKVVCVHKKPTLKRTESISTSSVPNNERRYPIRANRRAPERFTFPPDWRCTDDYSDEDEEGDESGSDVDSIRTEDDSSQSRPQATQSEDDSWIVHSSEDDEDSECSYVMTEDMTPSPSPQSSPSSSPSSPPPPEELKSTKIWNQFMTTITPKKRFR